MRTFPNLLGLIGQTDFGKKTMSDVSSERWVSVPEVAKHLGVKEDTIYKWISRKAFPAHKAGKLWKFKKSEVDAWVLSGDTTRNFKNARPAQSLQY